MRAVVQRVAEAAVSVAGVNVGRIKEGLLVFVGLGEGDSTLDVNYLAGKVAHLRIFEDDQHGMNQSLLDVGGDALVVSQFTLFGDCRKGRRPSFNAALPPGPAEPLFHEFVAALQSHGISVATGRFGANMEVASINSGPVTLLLDSKKLF